MHSPCLGLPLFCFTFSSEITSVEQLPRPKPVSRAPMTEAFMAQNPTGTVIMQIEIKCWYHFFDSHFAYCLIFTEAKNAARNDVRIADQIAIRSFVLGPTVPKIGKITYSHISSFRSQENTFNFLSNPIAHPKSKKSLKINT